MPPGSGRLIGSGVLVTTMVGGTSVMVTVAWDCDVTVWPWLSRAVTVIVSVWEAPALPKKLPVKEQV